MSIVDNGFGVYTVDSSYWRKQMAAVYLIKHAGELAIVETAHVHSLPRVLEAISELGLTKDDVKYIFLTHIHLDHAGGAGAYMEQFKQAQLVVHPKGVRHMQNPSKLEAGACVVYGAEFVQKMYGKLLPIAADRIITAEDGTVIDFNGRRLVCRNAPGHANHHNIIFDDLSQGIFSGDVFGIGYPELNINGNALVFPSTTPVNFDPDKMRQSIDLIISHSPQVIYLTHFGAARNITQMAADLRRMLDGYIEIAKRYVNEPEREKLITNALNDYFVTEAQALGVNLSSAEIIDYAGLDMQINAQGLVVWLGD